MADVFGVLEIKSVLARLGDLETKVDGLTKLCIQLLERMPHPESTSLADQLELTKLERDELLEALQRQVRS